MTANPALFASLLAALLAFLGVMLAAFNTRWVDDNSSFVAAFAAGVLVTSAVVHLIPGALANGWQMAFVVVGGYVAMYLLGEIIPCNDHHHHEDGSISHQKDGGARLAVISLLAISVHSIVDGLEYPVLFAHGIETGIVSSAGLILHEVAEGIIVFALLRTAGLSMLNAILLATLAAALTTPFGTVVSLFLIEGLSKQTLAVIFALAAGSVLYLGSTHLPRHIRTDKRGPATLAFLGGVAVAIAFTLGHDHAGHDHAAHAHGSHGEEVAHDHDGDGKPDHAPHEHAHIDEQR